jgi:hypothetical protein
MARIVVSGHEQDFALGMPVAKCYCEFNSIHGVHYYVAEQMVEWLNGRKLNCSLGAVGSDCREAMDIQNLCEGVGNYFVVVDNQYLGLALGAHHSSTSLAMLLALPQDLGVAVIGSLDYERKIIVCLISWDLD